jgi:hypothetical protein
MARRLIRSLVLPLVCATAACVPGNRTLPHTSLAAYVAELKNRIPGSGTNAFVAPPQADVDAFQAAMAKLLAGDTTGATSAMNPLGYDVLLLNDQPFQKSYLVAEERQSGFRGLGTYVVDPTGFARNIVVEGPHPLFDADTENESQRIFQEIGARALFIGGTHRCANPAQASPCSGTTNACEGKTQPYRVSDAPHFVGNFINAAHAASVALASRPKSFSVHGNASSAVDVELSDGTRNDAPPTADVNRLREALAARSVSVGSCNAAADRNTFSLNLCGTDDTEGRHSNGSPDACGAAANAASGFFLHIEQHPNVRANPAALIDAIKEVLPPDGASSRR